MTQLNKYPISATGPNHPLFDVFFKDVFKSDFPFTSLRHEFKTGYPVDIYYEDLDGPSPTMNFEFALPGVDPEEVQITKTKDGELRIQHNKQKHDVENVRDYYSRSISKRNFDLTWKIPRRFSLEKMEAKFKNGLLTIKIPRSEESIPESVTIISE